MREYTAYYYTSKSETNKATQATHSEIIEAESAEQAHQIVTDILNNQSEFVEADIYLHLTGKSGGNESDISGSDIRSSVKGVEIKWTVK